MVAAVTQNIEAKSNDPGQIEVIDSLNGVTSIPVLQQIGSTVKLVRVLVSILRGVDGREVFLQVTETHLQWRYTDGMWDNLIALADLKGDKGETPVLRTNSNGIEWKYESEEEDAWKELVSYETLKLKFTDLTSEQIDAFWRSIPEDIQLLFQKPAQDAADKVIKEVNEVKANLTADVEALEERAETVIRETSESKALVDKVTKIAQSVSDHPGYIGSDYYVWDYISGSYNKTDTVLRPEGFSIYRTYPSVEMMEADLTDVPEGKFVLINTNDVEVPDNAKLYVRGATSFEYLVDMSGAIGFTGKTPQITIGNVTVGSSASATLSPAGFDEDGNPMYKLNLVVVPGPRGFIPLIETGTVTTGEAGGEAAVDLLPNGQTEDGRDKYLLNFVIPQGLPGEGFGNLAVDPSGVLAGKKYLLMFSRDGMPESGTPVSYTHLTLPTTSRV